MGQAGRISQAEVDRVTDQADIVTVVGHYVELKRAGREMKGICPFHDDHSPSLSVNPRKGVYYCPVCHTGGNAVRFVQQQEGQNFPQALERMAQIAGIEPPAREGQEAGSGRERDRHQALLRMAEQVARFYEDQLRSSQGPRDYLKRRGAGPAAIDQFRLGYAPAGGSHLERFYGNDGRGLELLKQLGFVREYRGKPTAALRDRLVFPIRDAGGRVRAFGGRYLGDNEKAPKYLNTADSPIFAKRYQLYGLYESESRLGEGAVVVEGYFDVVCVWAHGGAAVAPLGTALSAGQLKQLLRRTESIRFCFDGDQGGEKALDQVLDMCWPTFDRPADMRVMRLPEGQDPDDVLQAGTERWRELWADAVPLSLTWLSQRAGGATSPEAKARALELLVEDLAEVPHDCYRATLTAAVAEQLELPFDVVARLSTEARRRMAARTPADPKDEG